LPGSYGVRIEFQRRSIVGSKLPAASIWQHATGPAKLRDKSALECALVEHKDSRAAKVDTAVKQQQAAAELTATAEQRTHLSPGFMDHLAGAATA
jgi:hypothetical protein